MKVLTFLALLLLTCCVPPSYPVDEDSWQDPGPDNEPADEEPADEEPADDEPADEKPTDDEPADEKPTDEEVPEDAPEPIDASAIGSSSFPSELACGEIASAQIGIQNTGDTVWTREEGYKLGGVGDEDPFAAHRVWLPDGVEIVPGQEWVFTIELEAPPEEGTFVTDWRMVHEAVHWFGEIASEIVEVTCPPAPGPPPIASDFSNVVWIHDDISQWPQTVTLTASKGINARINIPNNGTTCGPGDVCWPNFNPTYVQPGDNYYNEFVGGVWIFVYRDDVWLAGLFDSILRNQQIVWDHNLVPGSGWPGGQLNTFQPVSGERYGWMISTALPVLSTQFTVNERSNVSEFVWP